MQNITAVVEKLRLFALPASRALGACVCAAKGEHLYIWHFTGSFDNWHAYQCLRCGELDRPLESLPSAPDAYDAGFGCADEYADREAEDRQYNQARQWHPALPFPRWI